MIPKLNRKILLLVIGYLLLVLFVPMLTSAAGFPYWGPLVSCPGGTCKSLCDLLATGQNIIYFMMTLAVLAIGPVMIVVGGIMMLVAAGSPERFSSGRKMATGAIIGITIALGAFVLLNTFFVLIAVGTGGITVGGKPFSWSNIQCASSGTNFQPGGGGFGGHGATGSF